MKSTSLSSYINSKLRIYQYAVPVVMALLVAFVATAFLLYVKISSDQSLLREISPHLSTLVETQDRTELLRLIRSIAGERKAQILLVRNEHIVATSDNLSLIDRPYIQADHFLTILGSKITKTFISSTLPVLRSHGPQTQTIVILNTPIIPTLIKCLTVMAVALIAGFFLSFLFAYRIKKLVQNSVAPIENLDIQIKNLRNIDSEAILNSLTGISEFDSIQDTIIETQKALVDARDIKAKAKAKEMTDVTYQKLIHDIAIPVSALQQMIVTASSTVDPFDKERASLAIPKLASQILSQIQAAKENLEVDIEMLAEKDLRECVEDSIFQSIQNKSKVIELSKTIPNHPVVVAHDPTYLIRAINNLISNAIQACKEKVSITLVEQTEKIIIRVEDDGPGINFENVSKYLFGKGDSTKADRRAFGLASANHIVRQHGGRIISKPSNLGGACFEVQL